MSQITIKDIQVLTPAIVTYVVGDETRTADVRIDFKSQVVHLPPGAPQELADLFFPFLMKSLEVPDSYEAAEDVYEQAEAASQEFERNRREYVGDDDA